MLFVSYEVMDDTSASTRHIGSSFEVMGYIAASVIDGILSRARSGYTIIK
jgi:hypothetical protein